MRSGGEASGYPLMGLPSDPARDLDEVTKEIRSEIEARRRKGGAAAGVGVVGGVEKGKMS